MLTYMRRGVGLVALLSIHLMGSEGAHPYFQADGQPPVYLVTGTIHHRGLAWTHEGDTLTIKLLADQPPVPFQQLEIGYPTGTVVLGCGVEVVGKLNIAARIVHTNDTGPSPLLRVGQPDDGATRSGFLSVANPVQGPVCDNNIGDYLKSVQTVALFENNGDVEKANAALLAKFGSSEWQAFLQSHPDKRRLSAATLAIGVGICTSGNGYQ